MSNQRTHDGLVLVGTRVPYEVRKFPTLSPTADEITVHIQWTASTPLDLHQADGGLLVEPPMRTGSTGAGIVTEVGTSAAAQHFAVGDRVFGFAHQKPAWKTHQEYATAPWWVFGKVPKGVTLEEAVTLPENFVTAFHTVSADLGLPVPWPKPAGYVPARADEERVLVWGAASSVGQLTIQVLRYYGYRNIVGTASPRHHAYLKELGAKEVYDYRSPTVVEDLLRGAAAAAGAEAGEAAPAFPLIVDCIGSREGTLRPISKVAQNGSTVAVMLPVIVTHASAETAPEYSMDAGASAAWASGVTVSGVRTHFYWRVSLEFLLTLNENTEWN